jgi:hypothetical protein
MQFAYIKDCQPFFGFGSRGSRMGGEIISLLIALPIAAALLLLVPRRAARAWAIWLLVCLMAGSLQWIGQAVYGSYHPEKFSLFTWDNQLEFQKNQAGEVTSVVVNNPPEQRRSSGSHQQAVTVAGSSLLFAFAILTLLLRAEPPAASPETAARSSNLGAGISIQLFGLAVLVVLMAQAIAERSGTVNVFGVVVIASGFYVSRESRLAAKWALLLMALLSMACISFVFFMAVGENVIGIGPSEAPWAIAIGLTATAWAVVNLLLTFRFLRQTTDSADQTNGTNDTY